MPSPYTAEGPGLHIAAPKTSTSFNVTSSTGRKLRVSTLCSPVVPALWDLIFRLRLRQMTASMTHIPQMYDQHMRTIAA